MQKDVLYFKWGKVGSKGKRRKGIKHFCCFYEKKIFYIGKEDVLASGKRFDGVIDPKPIKSKRSCQL
jgi:hypothetical protein